MWSFCHVFPMLEEYQMAGRGQAPIGHLFIQASGWGQQIGLEHHGHDRLDIYSFRRQGGGKPRLDIYSFRGKP